MKHLLACASALLLSTSAHASIVTFQYTARIDSIVAGITFYQAGTSQDTFALRNGTIASGDIVTGTLSYDTSTVSTPSVHDNGSSTLYSDWSGRVTLTAGIAARNMGLGGYGPTSYLWVDDASRGLGLQDGMHVHAYSYDWSGTPAEQVVSLSMKGADTVLDSGALPGSVSGFGTKEFSFTFKQTLDGQLNMMRATGDITSMTLISAVPEPATYAMFAAGLALVAWRRKRG